MILQWIFALSLVLLVNAVPPMRLSNSGYELISFADRKNDDYESLKISRNFPKMSGFKILGITKPSDEFESLVPRQDRKIHYENGKSNPKQNTVESLFKDQVNPSSYPTKYAFRTSDQDQSDTLSINHQDKSSGITLSKSIDPKYQNSAIKNDTEKNDTMIQDSDFEYSDIHSEDTRQEKPVILSEDPKQNEKDKQYKPEIANQPQPTIMKFVPGPRGFLTLQKSTNFISPIYTGGYDVTSYRSTYKSIPFATSDQSRSQDDSSTRHKYSKILQDDFEPHEILRQNIAREKNEKFLLLNSLKHFLLKNKMSHPRAPMAPTFISFPKSIPVSASSPRHYHPSIPTLNFDPMTSPMALSISHKTHHRTEDSEPKDTSDSNEVAKGSLIIDIVHEVTSDDSEDPRESRADIENKKRTKDPCRMKERNEFYEFLAKFGSNVMETALRYETSTSTDLTSSATNSPKGSSHSKDALKQKQ